MATVKIKLRPSAVDGNAGTIYYQITHKRLVRQLKTDYRVFDSEWDGSQSAISLLNAAEERIASLLSMQNRISRDMTRLNMIIRKFECRNRPYTSADVAEAFVRCSQELSFFGFHQNVIEKLKQLNKYRTAENYTTALNSFKRFAKDEYLMLGDIDCDLMMRYEAYLAGRGVAKNTISFYMRILRAVYNRAVEQELTEQRTPFRHVYTGVDKTVKRAISFADIKRIKELDLSSHPTLDFARDMFLFSFCTRGMSFIDMAYLKKTQLRCGVISYCRRKTGQRLTVKWEKCMQEIAAKYADGSDSPYLLPILRFPFDDHRRQYRSRLVCVNKSLKTVAEMAEIGIPLTMYVARHSWASIARSKRIPVSVISECMGHDSEVTTQIYLASLDTAVIDRANRLVLRDL